MPHAGHMNGKIQRSRQAALYEEQMGHQALARQLVAPAAPKSRRFVEPDECNCGWIGGKARSFGEHHTETCPRRRDPLEV